MNLTPDHMLEALTRVDKHWLLWLNGHNSPFFDWLMYAASGRFEWIPLYLIILALIVRRFSWKSVWIILAAVIMITLSDQIANILKAEVRRPRPCKDPEIGYLVHLVNQYCSGAYGFVSGHATNSWAFATLISLIFRNKWLTAGMICWATLVSYSRIYLGAHYPGDVMSGAMIGIMLAWIVYAVLNHFVKGINPSFSRSA